MTASTPRIQCFDGYQVDAVARRVRNPDGAPVPMTSKALDVLLYLIAHRDRVVGKDELLAAVWAGRVVEENNLTQAVSALRRALGTGAGDHRYVVTVPGRGYRFVAELDQVTVQAPGKAGAAGSERRARLRPMRVLLWALVATVVSSAVVWLSTGSRRPVAGPESVPVLAVLPFQTLGGGPRDELLELGMAETLIGRLGSGASLRVLSLGAVQDFAGASIDPVQAGTSLGADYVVDGSIQRQGERIRINARLTALPEGRAMWTGTFDQAADKVFLLQDALAAAMAPALPAPGAARPRHRSRCDGADADAYRAYLRGLHLMNRPEGNALPSAVASFRQAIDRDPQCARAWAAIAFASRAMAITADGEPGVVFPPAKAAVANALRIDPDSAQAYTAKGFIEFWYDWDWAASEASLRHAIALDGNYPEAHFALAHLLNNTGRLDEALPHARKATALDPMSPIMNSVVASFFLNDGQVEEGARRLERVLQTDPGFWVALMMRAMAGFEQDRQRAFAQLRAARDACNGCSVAEAQLAQAHVLAGEREEAGRVLRGLERRRDGGYVPATRIAAIHVALGRHDAALDELERGYRERDTHLAFLAIDGAWRPLQGNPRFEAIRRRLDLPAPEAR